jgi:calcineurin-like phosphoesterase family protein
VQLIKIIVLSNITNIILKDDVVYQLVDVEPDEYNYFDKNALSNLNWAGPNHWKFKTKSKLIL